MDETHQFKELLKKAGCDVSDEELDETLIKLKYLIEVWLNEVEKEIFEGKTLQELLAEGNL